jgi:hypothetical protein
MAVVGQVGRARACKSDARLTVAGWEVSTRKPALARPAPGFPGARRAALQPRPCAPRFLERFLVRPDLTWTEATTAPVAVVNFMNHEGWEWGKIAAGGTMVMLPVLFFSILVRKFLVHGLTAGALKG